MYHKTFPIQYLGSSRYQLLHGQFNSIHFILENPILFLYGWERCNLPLFIAYCARLGCKKLGPFSVVLFVVGTQLQLYWLRELHECAHTIYVDRVSRQCRKNVIKAIVIGFISFKRDRQERDGTVIIQKRMFLADFSHSFQSGIFIGIKPESGR